MRFVTRFAALAALLVLLPIGAGAASGDRQIPYRDCGGLICLEVPLAGQRHLFLLDTGNVNSVVDLPTARKLGLALVPAKRRDQPDQVVPGVFKTTLPDSVVTDFDLAAPASIALDIGSLRTALGMRVDGMLAYTAFKDRVLQIDPVRHVMTVSQAAADVARPGAQRYPLRLVTFGSKGPPVVTAEGIELNGQKFLAQLDTVFPEGAMLFPATRDALGLGAVKPVGRRVLSYYDDNAELLRLPPGTVDFGNPLFAVAAKHVFLPGKGVHAPDNEIALVVGAGWFGGKQVTLDLKAMAVTLAPLG